MKVYLTVVILWSTLSDYAVAQDQCEGDCLDWPTNICIAGWEEGLCSGGRNRRCCQTCDSRCMSQEQTYRTADGACNSTRGNCQHVTNYCNGQYVVDMCGGPATRQCCDPKAALPKDCPLVFYNSSNVKGFNNHVIRIHPSFLQAMQFIDEAAQTCNVTVFISHSFRKRQNRTASANARPSRTQTDIRSNHLVGHAIKIAGLQTASGWCNGKCIMEMKNLSSACFINQIKGFGLTWGGDFSPADPVYIDDAFRSNVQLRDWKSLVKFLQTNC